MKKQAQVGPSHDLDPNEIARRAVAVEAIHVNVRIAGDDARIYEYVKERSEGITDSQRIREALRIVAYVMARRDRGSPIKVLDEADRDVELLEFVGAFVPQTKGSSASKKPRRSA